MRETKYAVELTDPATRRFPNGDEARIEKLHIKESGEEEVRFSWWKDGKMIPRPLDLSENDLLLLLRDAFSKDVFTPFFKEALRKLI
jgi:hypothetical protein